MTAQRPGSLPPAPHAARADADTGHLPLAAQRLLSQALDAVRHGDLEAANDLLQAGDAGPLTLSQVFRLYQAELESQARQLQDSHARTEQALDWSSRLFRTLPVAAILVDQQGLIVDANEHALDELGLRQALRVLPVPLRRLLADTHTELRLAALLPEAQAGRTVALDDVALRTLAGEPRWADVNITQVPSRGGRAEGPLHLCVFNDRTARVEAQRAREVATAAEHARDLAQSASRAKTQLLSRVSHELRTPLNAVIGFSHLLLQDESRLDAQGRRQVGHIAQAGQHLLDLVDEVLQINRAEVGLLQVEQQPVDLWRAAQQALELHEPMAAALSVQMQLLPLPPGESPAPLALADPRRVREVLTNLLTNAIKYNRPGGWVQLSLLRQGDQLALSVADSGIGISPAQQAHLFEPFNRLGAERLKVAGHGLGLSIARTLVQAMGGQLQVRSTEGEGSCFTLRLPAAPAG